MKLTADVVEALKQQKEELNKKKKNSRALLLFSEGKMLR
jgi:hypothetical protein